MSKTIDFLLAASMVLVAIFISSCSSHSGLEEMTLSSGSEGIARSSSSAAVSSSSSEEARGSATASSSSSEEVSGSAAASSSSSEEMRSSSSTPSSSPSAEPLACGTVPAQGYATLPITPPALTCGNGETATGISWLGSPVVIDWNNPKDGTYSNIGVTANCGKATSLIASCPGTLTVQPMISCSMASVSAYEGTAITLPELACSDGSVPFDIVFSGYLPNWDNPVAGSYAVLAEANCGQGTLPAVSCGTLTVNPVKLTCGSVAASEYEGIEINPPDLTCSHGTRGTPTWSGNAPNWSNPAVGTYSNISVTANCGLATKTANCSGTLTVNPVTLNCGSVSASEYEGTKINPPNLTCSHGTRGTPTWTNAPNWNNPTVGIYNNINVTATCGLATKTANCNGILSVNPVTLTCGSVPTSGISGIAITPPALTCSNDGGAPTDISWLTNAPYWSDPMPGTYSNISVTATCGLTTKTTTCSGILTVDPVTLICGSVPTSGISGFAITPPALACNDGRTPTKITWSANTPNWSSPEIGTYSDISSTATCGTESGLMANCSGSLNVSCSGKYNTSTHYCSEGTMKEYDSVTYEGQTYKTVVIGTQTWMAENLNYVINGSKCYNNLDSNCDTYGRLYDLYMAVSVCPSGWHLPTQKEWDVMMTYIGGMSTAGKMLKATSDWNGNSADIYGFSALSDGSGFNGSWWSASVTEFSNSHVYYLLMSYNSERASWSYKTMPNFSSVRCIKN